jgi:general secretion pathway protein H
MTSTIGPSNRLKRPVEAGFTLLELILVMVVICTMLGVAAPSLRRFFVSRATDDTAARILNLTKLARTLAVTDGEPQRLLVEPAQGACYLTALHHGSEARPASSLGRPVRLPEGIFVSLEVPGAALARDYVEFSPDGSAEPAVVTLTDIKGGIVRVSCSAPTEPFTIFRGEETP